MGITVSQYIERINELLNKKLSLLKDIWAITQKQTDTIQEDRLDELGALIDEKQKKIDLIEKIDEEFGVYFERMKSAFGISRLDQLDVSKLENSAQGGARSLKSLTSEVMGVIKEISEVEKTNSNKSKELLNEFGNQIRNINSGKKVNNAYRPASYEVPSYFLDKKK